MFVWIWNYDFLTGINIYMADTVAIQISEVNDHNSIDYAYSNLAYIVENDGYVFCLLEYYNSLPRAK